MPGTAAFSVEVTVLGEDRRVSDFISLDFCTAFDSISHEILVSKLEKDGFDR